MFQNLFMIYCWLLILWSEGFGKSPGSQQAGEPTKSITVLFFWRPCHPQKTHGTCEVLELGLPQQHPEVEEGGYHVKRPMKNRFKHTGIGLLLILMFFWNKHALLEGCGLH